MKKCSFLITVLVCMTGGSFLFSSPSPILVPATQAGDARVLAMGGAFTAVADDADALFYNPAGLAYLRRGNLKTGMSALFDFNSSIVGLDIYEHWDDEQLGFGTWDLKYDWNGDFVYVDENNNWYYDGAEETVDLTAYGFTNDWDGIDAMIGWYDGLVPVASAVHGGLDSLKFLPNIAYAGRNFGVGLLGGVTIKPAVVTYGSDFLDYGFELSKKSGVITGAGFAFGPLAVGANLKYYREAVTLFGLPNDSYIDFREYAQSLVPGSAGLQDALYEILVSDAIAVHDAMENHLEAGLGAMLTLGSLTVGGYVDSILGIVLDDSGSIKKDFGQMVGDALKTANFGVSYDPSMRRYTGREPFLNFILSADLKNIGDNSSRYLNLGSEFGIHIGPIAQVDFRAGYKQFLTGPLNDAFGPDFLKIESGELSFGVGAKALFFEFNMAATAPAKLVRDIILFGPEDFEELDEDAYFGQYNSNFIRLMFSFGMDI